MALIYAEKFAKYAATADIAGDNPHLTGGNGITLVDSAGRFGGRVASYRSAANSLQFPWDAETASETVIILATFKWQEFGGNQSRVLARMTTTNTSNNHWRLEVNYDGYLLLFNATGTQVGVSTQPLGNNIWRTLEIKVNAANSGNVQVRVDGIEVLNVNSDFRNGTSGALTTLFFSGTPTSNYFTYDEIVICDDTGSVLNDFLGDMRLVFTGVDGDGSITDWAASAGDDYECVDDALATYDDDTTYVSSDTVDQDEYFTHTVSAPNVDAIRFVMLTALVRYDESGNDAVQLQVNSNGDVVRSASDITVGTSYQWVTEIFTQDPDTTAPWELAALNDAEFGIRCRP